MTGSYEKVAGLVNRVRNARYGEMVSYLEELIDAGDWHDFTTPAGARLEFRDCEFDYFLLAMEIDPTLVRHAYLHATDVVDLPAKRLRLADITGRGRKPVPSFRRPWRDVAEQLEADSSGAAARIRAAQDNAGSWFVTERTGMLARDPHRRRSVEQGKPVRLDRPNAKTWRVRWSDEKSAAQAISQKLLMQHSLAAEVLRELGIHLSQGPDA